MSIVLTGNAGDGKTHIAKALERRLKDEASGFEFGYDATAMMNATDPWRRSWIVAGDQAGGKQYILAINQFPLYILRLALLEHLPDVAKELDRQWRGR